MSVPDGLGQSPPGNAPWATGRPVGQYPAPYPPGGPYPPAGYQPAAGPSSAQRYPAGSNQPNPGRLPSGAQHNSQLDTGPTVRPIGFGGSAPTPTPTPTTGTGTGTGMGMGLARLLGLSLATLGGLNFVLGFLPQYSAPGDYFSGENVSVFTVGPDYVPILLLIAGLLALAAFLPGSERSRLAVAAVSVGGAAGAIVSLGLTGPAEAGQVTKGMGAILLVIFGIIQAVVAVGAYVVGAGIGKPSPTGADRVGAGQPGPGQPGPGLVGPGPGAAAAPVGVGVASDRVPWQPSGATASAPGWVGSSVGGYATHAPAAPAHSTAMPIGYPVVPGPAADETPTGPQVVLGREPDRDDPRRRSPQGPVDPADDDADPTAADDPDGPGTARRGDA